MALGKMRGAVFDRYAFVAVTTRDLVRARAFWCDTLGFRVTEEEPGHHFIVDAGGLRLCVDLEDGDLHCVGSTDPIIGLRVRALDEVLRQLRERNVVSEKGPLTGRGGQYAIVRDPDGRRIVITEYD